MNMKVRVAALCLYALIIPAFIFEKSAVKDLESARARHKEMSILSTEYKSMKGRIDVIEQRDAVRDIKGIAQAIDSILSSLNMKEKMKSLRTAESREIRGGMTEEDAEVLMERLDMNELVNLLYRIENAPMMLSVKGIKMKKSFDNPELLNVTMTLALFVKKGEAVNR